MTKKYMIWLFIFIGGIMAAFLVGFTQENHAASQPIPQRWEKVKPRIQGIGYVEPVTQVRKLSFKASGIITECQTAIGKQVHKGDVLMVLENAEEKRLLAIADRELDLARAECSDLLSGLNKNEIRATEEELDLARERLAFAKKEFERRKELYASNTISASEFASMETNYKQAAIETHRMESQLHLMQSHVTPENKQVEVKKVELAAARRDLAAQRLADTKLIAPFDGTVLEILKREGEAVLPSSPEPVMLFADISMLQVRAEIDDRFVHALQTGQTVSVHGRGLGTKVYQGAIFRIKKIMGKKTIFTEAATERKDLDVIQVLVQMDKDFSAPVGLKVDVSLNIETS